MLLAVPPFIAIEASFISEDSIEARSKIICANSCPIIVFYKFNFFID